MSGGRPRASGYPWTALPQSRPCTLTLGIQTGVADTTLGEYGTFKQGADNISPGYMVILRYASLYTKERPSHVLVSLSGGHGGL
jgi:hypothetical protein